MPTTPVYEQLMRSLWMVVAGFLFSCMGVFVKLGAAHFSSIELVFYRSLFGLLLVYAVVPSLLHTGRATLGEGFQASVRC
jgi:drug/metabolite transporter (DMT)-like permease